MSDSLVSNSLINDDIAPQNQQLDSIWHNGKQYRKGYTTGSCATAAAKVAALMVLRQQVIDQISIVTPLASPCV